VLHHGKADFLFAEDNLEKLNGSGAHRCGNKAGTTNREPATVG